MDTIFSLSSLLVMPFWLLMIALPRWRVTRQIMRSPWISAAPALVYAALAIPRLAELLPALMNPQLGGVTALLGTPAGATLGWLHFLAFDLFVGRWAYLDSQERGMSAWLMAPILFATLMLGPIGFLLYLAARALVRGGQRTDEARRSAVGSVQ